MRQIFLVALGALFVANANAQSLSQAQLHGEWICPTDFCETVCTTLDKAGRDERTVYRAKTVRMFSYIDHPNRFLFEIDGQVVLLGENDHCTPGGRGGVIYKKAEPLKGTKFKQHKKPCHTIGSAAC